VHCIGGGIIKPFFVAENIFAVYIRLQLPKRRKAKDAEHGQSEVSIKLTELVVLIKGVGELTSGARRAYPS